MKRICLVLSLVALFMVAGAVVFAVMFATSPDTRTASLLLGEGVLMAAMSIWLFSLLPGFKEDLMDRIQVGMDFLNSEMPGEFSQLLHDQADAMTVGTGTGFWMIVLGSLLVLAGGIYGVMATKRPQ